METEEDCCICRESLSGTDRYLTSCRHVFHLACMQKWTKATCPLCRKPFLPVGGDKDEEEEETTVPLSEADIVTLSMELIAPYYDIRYLDHSVPTVSVFKEYAARDGKFVLLKSLHAIAPVWQSSRASKAVCAQAAAEGHLEILMWLRINGYPWDTQTCSKAAIGGHRDVLRLAFQEGCPMSPATINHAAAHGYWDIVVWAQAHGCPMNATLCAELASCGNLMMLEWARKQGCHWDERTIRHASSNGHKDIVIWAVVHGCPVGSTAIADAASARHFEIAKWLTEWLRHSS